MAQKIAQIVDMNNAMAGEVALDEGVFGAVVRPHLVHDVVRMQLAKRRRGTASTRTRSEVRGGGKKPWKQKGTGRARAGRIRSPLWRGRGSREGASSDHPPPYHHGEGDRVEGSGQPVPLRGGP